MSLAAPAPAGRRDAPRGVPRAPAVASPGCAGLGGLLMTVTVLFLSSFVTFGLGALGDANPAAAVLGETATPADIARLNHAFGLDRPLIVQYLDWIGSALHGDLGTSYFTSIPVSDSIATAAAGRPRRSPSSRCCSPSWSAAAAPASARRSATAGSTAR